LTRPRADKLLIASKASPSRSEFVARIGHWLSAPLCDGGFGGGDFLRQQGRDVGAAQSAAGGIEVTGGMVRSACSASRISRLTGSPANAMLRATRCGMLSQRLRAFSADDSLRQFSMISFQSMCGIVCPQQGLSNRITYRALIHRKHGCGQRVAVA